MNNLTPREQAALEEAREFFLDGGEACIACMVKMYWGIDLIHPVTGKVKYTNEYIVYKQKQHRIVNRLYSLFKKMEAIDQKNGFAARAREGDKLWLMAVSPCLLHPGYKLYKLLKNPVDYELVDNIARTRIESIFEAKEKRFDQAIRQFPEVFQPRIKHLKLNVPYILTPPKKKKK